MCVIFYQTTKQPKMTYDEFVDMAIRNRDGMGWMAIIDDKVVYKKGYFDVNKFYEDYLKLRATKGCTEIACHFRIGTGSSVDKANCHPFPITKNKNRIKSTMGSADVCIMMNGIIGNSTKEFSDTALYVMNNLKSYYDFDNRFWLNFDKRNLMLFENEISGNRFIFMSKEGSKLFGSGWTDYEGKCQVSNRYWIRKTNTDFENYYCTDYTRFYSDNCSKHKSYIDYLESGVVG